MQVSKNDIACWRPDDLAEAVWDALVHRLWHATSIAGLRAILSDGCIRVVEENVGTKYRVAPLMLARGWVSLFDFGPTAGPAWLLRAQYRNWAGWLSGEPLMHMAPVARVCHQMLRLRLGRGKG